MRIGPGMSSQIARAYGVQPAAPARTLGGAAGSVGAGERPVSNQPTAASRLIGAVVPGKISFAGETPTQEGAIALYRHPADKNAAATGVQAGRVIDITA
jgi:hypothetical protein